MVLNCNCLNRKDLDPSILLFLGLTYSPYGVLSFGTSPRKGDFGLLTCFVGWVTLTLTGVIS